MAVTREGKETAVILKVETGYTDSGSAKYSSRTQSSINPDVSDDNLLSYATALAGLQVYPLGMVQRRDTVQLVEG